MKENLIFLQDFSPHFSSDFIFLRDHDHLSFCFNDVFFILLQSSFSYLLKYILALIL